MKKINVRDVDMAGLQPNTILAESAAPCYLPDHEKLVEPKTFAEIVGGGRPMHIEDFSKPVFAEYLVANTTHCFQQLNPVELAELKALSLARGIELQKKFNVKGLV